MADKALMEKVLHASLTDEQVNDIIKVYYRDFYENPEKYAGDSLLDLIKNDCDIRSTSFMDEVQKYVNINRSFSEYGYNGGLFEDEFFAVVTATDEREVAYLLNEFEAAKNVPIGEHDIVGDFYTSDEGNVTITQRDSHTNGLAEPKHVNSPSFKYLGTVTLMTPGLMMYVIPYNDVGKGVTPIMWKVCFRPEEIAKILTTAEDITSFLEENRTSNVAITNEVAKSMYNNFRATHPASDAQRFIYIKAYDTLFCYNTKNVAYNGTQHYPYAMTPLLAIMAKVNNMPSNLGECIKSGVYDDLCIGGTTYDGSASSDGITAGAQVRPADDYSGKSKEASGAKSPIGKMLDRATDKYE